MGDLNAAAVCEMLGGTTEAAGHAAVERMLKGPAQPTAIVCGSVRVTAGVVEALVDHRIDVPQALSLIGFGDPTWARWWRGGLTTLRLPVEEVATSCGLWFLHSL